eukprot:TRINITY_DN72061_c0_g1_i1.p1 TRINITY_DN72061_c0_g1~~TRINITY_DN72061_c0_g1_i1.p1  ORF type:complete len:372 (+),score=76.10 TRINITY_DN72061_c0_g1_i1:60-1175(+)
MAETRETCLTQFQAIYNGLHKRFAVLGEDSSRIAVASCGKDVEAMMHYTAAPLPSKRGGLFVPCSPEDPAPPGFPLRYETYVRQHGRVPHAIPQDGLKDMFEGGANLVPMKVTMRDARRLIPSPRLKSHGFELMSYNGSATQDAMKDLNTESIKTYYKEIEQLLIQKTGADAAFSFVHAKRIPSTRRVEAEAGYASYWHTDQSHKSWSARLHELFGQHSWEEVGPPGLDEAAAKRAAAAQRYAVVTAWRYLGPAASCRESHLAIVDPASVDASDVIDFSLIACGLEGGNYRLRAPAPDEKNKHICYYYPEMVQNEILCFIVYDSKPNAELTKKFASMPSPSCFHGAFSDPTAPKDEPKRESVDVRCLLVWD